MFYDVNLLDRFRKDQSLYSIMIVSEMSDEINITRFLCDLRIDSL